MSGYDNQIINFFFSEYCIDVLSVTLLSILQGVNDSSRFLWGHIHICGQSDRCTMWMIWPGSDFILDLVRYVWFWKSSSPKNHVFSVDDQSESDVKDCWISLSHFFFLQFQGLRVFMWWVSVVRCYSDSSCANVLSIHLRFSVSNDDLLSNIPSAICSCAVSVCALSFHNSVWLSSQCYGGERRT